MIRYAKDKKSASTNSWEFDYGRLSNASIETYSRTIKISILGRATNLRPNEFLMENYNHIMARFKGDFFGVAQSSRNRKKKRAKKDGSDVEDLGVVDLNKEDNWQRRPTSKKKQNRTGAHFSEKVSETVACKLS